MVSHSYVVGLYLILNCSVFVHHVVSKLHVCHPCLEVQELKCEFETHTRVS